MTVVATPPPVVAEVAEFIKSFSMLANGVHHLTSVV
jgi:hypothetical protein